MSQLIVTSRYLRNGTKKAKSQRKNYTKYIATRETVEIHEQKKEYPTDNQNEFLSELLNDFPEAKKYLEYEDYKKAPTADNTSELINTIIERNADVIGNRQNFVGYMALRPGAERRGAHGLFNESNAPIVLDRVANEVANHPGNVWSHVISLRREDAIRLGYDNSERWRDLVMRHISDIAEQTRIPLCDMKWYAAFHDTTHHPHIHLIVYSKNPKHGFLTKQGIDKIRSVFANDIFHDELQSIYQEQTVKRDELKAESKKYVESLVEKIHSGEYFDPQLVQLVQKLKQQLNEVSGKKVYGYLKPDVKKTVDEIFKRMSQDPNITELYKKWCELERQKYKTYTQKEKEFPPIYENKVFQPVRNMIIRQIDDMQEAIDHSANKITADPEKKIPSQPNESADETHTADNEVNSQCSEDTCDECGSAGDTLAPQENEVAQPSPESNGNPPHDVTADTILGLFINLSKILADDYEQRFKSERISVDRKLRKLIREKNESLGIKNNYIQ